MGVSLEATLFYDVELVDDKSRFSERALRTRADAVLVDAARAGDADAFGELVRRYRNDVYGLAYHFVRNREDAWDIAQEVFIKAHRGIRRFRGDASFKTWLLRITTNRCKDHYKKRRLRTVSMDDMERPENLAARERTPAGELEAREVGEAIERALDALSPKHRAAIVLREYEGLSYDDMAGAMNCSVGTVMSRLHNARRNLRRVLEEMGVMDNETHG